MPKNQKLAKCKLIHIHSKWKSQIHFLLNFFGGILRVIILFSIFHNSAFSHSQPNSAISNSSQLSIVELNGVNYEVLSTLGSGGFGSTYKVRMAAPPYTEMALKILDYDGINFQKNAILMRHQVFRAYQKLNLPKNKKMALRFTPEIVRIKLDPNREFAENEKDALYAHPNIDLAILSPLAVSDLEQKRVSRELDSVEKRVQLSYQVITDVLPELGIIAELNLVHNDIKPENILLSNSGHFGINDFDTLIESGMISTSGTPIFIAPERLTEDLMGANYISDIYSFGMSVLHSLFSENEIEKIIVKNEIDSDKLKSKLLDLKIKISSTNQNLLPNFIEIEKFILTTLIRDPEQRKNAFEQLSFSGIDMSELFSKKIKPALSINSARNKPPTSISFDDLNKLKHLLGEYSEKPNSSISLRLKLNAFTVSSLKDALEFLAFTNEYFVESLRAAQIMNIPISSQKKALQQLQNAPFKGSQQLELLRVLIQKSPDLIDSELAAIFLNRFILSIHALDFTPNWILEIVSGFPEILTPKLNLIEKKISSNKLSFENKQKLALLYVGMKNIPDIILDIWLETIVDDNSNSELRAHFEKALAKVPKINSRVTDTFLKRNLNIDYYTTSRFKLLLKFPQFEISKSNSILQELLHSKYSEYRKYAALILHSLDTSHSCQRFY